MSYRVICAHVESLHDGRTVIAGETISDADAQKNPRLIERGVLVKEPDRRKQRAQKTDSGSTPEPKPASEQETKEESK